MRTCLVDAHEPDAALGDQPAWKPLCRAEQRGTYVDRQRRLHDSFQWARRKVRAPEFSSFGTRAIPVAGGHLVENWTQMSHSDDNCDCGFRGSAGGCGPSVPWGQRRGASGPRDPPGTCPRPYNRCSVGLGVTDDGGGASDGTSLIGVSWLAAMTRQRRSTAALVAHRGRVCTRDASSVVTSKPSTCACRSVRSRAGVGSADRPPAKRMLYVDQDLPHGSPHGQLTLPLRGVTAELTTEAGRSQRDRRPTALLGVTARGPVAASDPQSTGR